MAGNVPDPNAKRRNLDGQFSVVPWTELVDGEDVPPMPDGYWGRGACQIWDAIWQGPMRKELLPQHLFSLETLLRFVDKMEDPELTTAGLLKLSQELRLWSDKFGLDPAAIRKMRITVAPTEKASKPKEEEDDELAKKREMKERLAADG